MKHASSSTTRYPHILAVLFATALGLVLVSCPNPIEPQMALQATDSEGPTIIVESPSDGSTYASTVVVRGVVSDREGAVSDVTLTVPVLELEQAIEIGTDGSFESTFSTVGISTSIRFSISARDWNGNTVSVSRTLENDLRGPHVVITEPDDFSAYATVVRVSGRVTDAPGTVSTNEVASLRYEVPGTAVAGDLTPAADGAFTFEFATSNEDGSPVLEGSAVIAVIARDWNGNETRTSVSILRADTGDFAALEVRPANRSAVVSWEPVLYAEAYRIHNPRIGEIREYSGSENRYVWTGLENGIRYSFQVQALIPDERGQDAWSTLIDVIPLSERTLAPRIRENTARSVTIEWQPIPGTSEYVVERRGDGADWAIATITPDNVFTDSALPIDASRLSPEFRYRVRPVDQEDVPSDYIAVTPAAFTAESVADIPLSGWIHGLAEDQGVLVAADLAGLVTIDVTDPYAPEVLGSIDTAPLTFDVAVDDDAYAYVASDDAGLAVVDVFAPGSLTEPVYIDTPGNAVAVALDDNLYAYVADRAGGLAVIDVADPLSPQYVTSVTTIADAWDVYVDWPYAYVAALGGGLYVVDIGDPENPSVVGQRVTAHAAESVVVMDNFAYVAVGASGVASIDVSSPGSPGVPTYHPTGSDAERIIADGEFLYVLTDNGGVEFLDLAVPDDPRTFAVRGAPDSANGIIVAGDFLYAGGFRRMEVFDAATPVGTLPAGTSIQLGTDPWDLAASDGHLFVAAGSDGVSVLDVADPLTPLLVANRPTDDSALGLEVAGGRTFVAEGLIGLTILDGASVSSLTPRSSAETTDSAVDVALAGEYAFIADNQAGLTVIDVSDLDAPELVASRDTVGSASGIEVYGSHAFIADLNGGLAIIDVSDPLNPGAPVYEPASFAAWDVALSRDHAFIADGQDGVTVVDVSDPANPTTVTTLPLSGDTRRITIAGPYAYMADRVHGLVIVDVSNPANPVLVRGSSLYPLETIAVTGPYGYALSDTGELVTATFW